MCLHLTYTLQIECDYLFISVSLRSLGSVHGIARTMKKFSSVHMVFFLAGDNLMQAEECSHGGLKCNYFCRTFNVGSNKEFKESKQGYESLFKVSILLLHYV